MPWRVGSTSGSKARRAGWAVLILLDQLPRMIYRDTPRAFEGDRRAQVVAMQGLQKNWDYQLLPIQRVFVLLVLEHAEVLDWQNLCVERYQVLLDEQPEANRRLFEGFLDYAEQHQRVIARFGRFPHRNLVLERPSTSEEMDFFAGAWVQVLIPGLSGIIVGAALCCEVSLAAHASLLALPALFAAQGCSVQYVGAAFLFWAG
ncbi:hypothetical protein PPS11_34743 [Pseudomonas putida S11]|nr:hypothetical protein PPS11_34743 [Pseudomonas putida S11]